MTPEQIRIAELLVEEFKMLMAQSDILSRDDVEVNQVELCCHILGGPISHDIRHRHPKVTLSALRNPCGDEAEEARKLFELIKRRLKLRLEQIMIDLDGLGVDYRELKCTS